MKSHPNLFAAALAFSGALLALYGAYQLEELHLSAVETLMARALAVLMLGAFLVSLASASALAYTERLRKRKDDAEPTLTSSPADAADRES